MLRIKTRSLCVALLATICAAGFANAQTIDELTQAARMKKMEELTKSNLPNVNGINADIQPLPPSSKRTIDEAVVLLSISGVGSNLVAELASDGVAAKYKTGDVTNSKWKVVSINSFSVKISKAGEKSKTLTFWQPFNEDASQNNPSNSVPFSARMNAPYPPGMIER